MNTFSLYIDRKRAGMRVQKDRMNLQGGDAYACILMSKKYNELIYKKGNQN